ncbi:hypothetical protein Hanom_Chr03g00216541 [Helianthus anomalus]
MLCSLVCSLFCDVFGCKLCYFVILFGYVLLSRYSLSCMLKLLSDICRFVVIIISLGS